MTKEQTITDMEDYISRTKFPYSPAYDLWSREIDQIREFARKHTVVEAYFLAFNYGRAKGYRAALRSRKKARGE